MESHTVDAWASERSADTPNTAVLCIFVVEAACELVCTLADLTMTQVWSLARGDRLCTQRTFVTLLYALCSFLVSLLYPWGVYAVLVMWAVRLLWPKARPAVMRVLLDMYHQVVE